MLVNPVEVQDLEQHFSSVHIHNVFKRKALPTGAATHGREGFIQKYQ
jgi:hypothetical protein